jgi:hypothetical protein
MREVSVQVWLPYAPHFPPLVAGQEAGMAAALTNRNQ